MFYLWHFGALEWREQISTSTEDLLHPRIRVYPSLCTDQISQNVGFFSLLLQPTPVRSVILMMMIKKEKNQTVFLFSKNCFSPHFFLHLCLTKKDACVCLCLYAWQFRLLNYWSNGRNGLVVSSQLHRHTHKRIYIYTYVSFFFKIILWKMGSFCVSTMSLTVLF